MAIKTDIGAYKKIPASYFQKLQLRIATIVRIVKHPKNKSLYVLGLDCAAADEDMQVVAKLADSHKMEQLIGKQTIVLCNLRPTEVQGIESDGVLLTSFKGKKPVLISPQTPTPSGGRVSLLGATETAFKG